MYERVLDSAMGKMNVLLKMFQSDIQIIHKMNLIYFLSIDSYMLNCSKNFKLILNNI